MPSASVWRVLTQGLKIRVMYLYKSLVHTHILSQMSVIYQYTLSAWIVENITAHLLHVCSHNKYISVRCIVILYIVYRPLPRAGLKSDANESSISVTNYIDVYTLLEELSLLKVVVQFRKAAWLAEEFFVRICKLKIIQDIWHWHT